MPPASTQGLQLHMFLGSSPDLSPPYGGVEGRYSRDVHRNSQRKLESLKVSTDNYKSNNDVVSSEKKDYIYQKVTSEYDFDIVLKSLQAAEASCWYYGDCSSAEAKSILRNQTIGTFIMRNSSDPKYLFSLSVKTERGPTSVRIRYSRGLFQMDCEEHLKNKLPKFDNAIALVDFHIALSQTKAFSDCRWLEKSGRRDMTVTLKQPKRSCVPSLQHLCRLSVNSALPVRHIPECSTRKLPVPRSIQTYLEDYPYLQ